jgi:plastin-1
MAFVAQLFNTNPGLKALEEEEKKEMAGLMDDDEGDTREERAFRMWMNSLGIPKMYVNNLFSDAVDGLVLLKVIDKIEPGSVKWKKKVERKPNNRFKKLSNTNYAVDLGKQMKLSLVGVGGSDITDRNKKLILGFVWQLMRYHLLKFLSSISADGKPITDKDVLAWCNETIQNSNLDKKPQINSFSDDSLKDGLYFIHLVGAVEPDIVNWEIVTNGGSDEDQLLNARYAISLARKMGAIVFLLPEDIQEVRNKMCMTFCAAVMAESYKKSGKLKK